MVDVRVDAAVRDEPEEVHAPAAVERLAQRGQFSKNEPSAIDLLTRIRSW